MCKSEIFAEILNVVGKETEVSTELILSSSKVTEVVDARSIVVFFLAEYGLYPEQIATLLHKTSASIRYLISTFAVYYFDAFIQDQSAFRVGLVI